MEHAMRAAVVAFTNRYADDIFTEDGNDYVISKFHSYADMSGFFIDIQSEGTWSVKNANTWHVEHLKLELHGIGTTVDVALDVSYIDGEYVISGLAGKAPSHDDNDDRYSSMSDFENERDFPLFFVVPLELVKDDRSDDVVDTVPEDNIDKADFNSYFNAMDELIALFDGIIVDFKTGRQGDYSMIYVTVSDVWYNSETYQKERFAEDVAESIKRISKETGVSDFVSVYFNDTHDKRLAEPKLFGGYKILR